MEMLSLTRVVIPITLNCNLRCKYCYRNAGSISNIPNLTKDMKNYLKNLNNNTTECVCISGGEPLLELDKIKEIFSFVPKEIHKKIMSNCSYLTQEIVDYINQNEIELSISHDGKETKYLRGEDCLRDSELLSLILQIKKLSIFGVCTKYNPNPWDNYQDTLSFFNEHSFNYSSNVLFEDKEFPQLIENFDYKAFQFGYWKCKLNSVFRPRWFYKRIYKTVFENLNVLPNGDIVGMTRIHHKYGTIFSSLEEIKQNKEKLGDYNTCHSCSLFGKCSIPSQLASKHYCNQQFFIKDLNKSIKESHGYFGLCA